MASKSKSLPASIWSALVPAASPKAKRVPYRATPVSLRRPLGEAITDLERWLVYYKLSGTWGDYLKEYQGNKSSGLMNPEYTIRMQQHGGLVEIIAKVDEAFDAIHNYKPEDDLSEGVYRLVQSKNSANPRPKAQTREADLKKIGAWLKKKKYQKSADKAALRIEAMTVFKCSKTDVTDAARLAKLTRSYSKSPR
jgi:hypothetical protein